MGAKHGQSIQSMVQHVDNSVVDINRDLTKVPVIQVKPGPNVHNIQSRGRPAAGTVFPINPHIDDRGTVADAAINVFLPHARHHYVKMTLTNANPTITFKKLFSGLSSIFTIHLINGAVLSSLTFSPALIGAPASYNLGNTETNIFTIQAHNDGTVEEYRVIGGGSGGASPLTTKGDIYTYDTADARLAVGTDGYFLVADSAEATGLKWIANAITPAGTTENDHLQWDSGAWVARQNFEFGNTDTAMATSGFLRFLNDSIMLSARNAADDGNVEFKITGGDIVDITESNNGAVGLQLRAQDATNPDATLAIVQTSDIAASGGTVDIDALNSSTLSVSVDSVGHWVFDGAAGTNKSLLPINMTATQEITFDALFDVGIFSTAVDTLQIFTGGIIRAAYQNTLYTLGTDQLNTKTGSSIVHTFERPETLADDAEIGEIRFRAWDGISVINNYAKIVGVMASDVNTSEDGELQFYVAQGGTHDVLFMEMNGNVNTIDLWKNVWMRGGADIRMDANEITLDTSLTSSIAANTDNIITIGTNSTLRVQIDNTNTSITNELLLYNHLEWSATTSVNPTAGLWEITISGTPSLDINVPTGNFIALQVNASDVTRFYSDRVEFNDPIIFPISAGGLGTTEFGISRNGTVIEFNSDASYSFEVDGVEQALIATSYIRFPEQGSDPAAGTTSGKYYVKVVGGNAEPWFIGDGTAATSLLGGGGASNAISQLDTSLTITDTGVDGKISFVRDGTERFQMDNSNIFTFENASGFRMNSGLNSMTQLWIGSEFNQNVTTGEVWHWDIAGNNKFNIANTLITMTQDLDMTGSDVLLGGGDIRELDDIFFNAGGWQIRTTSTQMIINGTAGASYDFQVQDNGISRFSYIAGNFKLNTASGASNTLTFQTGNTDRLIFTEAGSMQFITGSADIIFLEGGTETMLYDASANTWDIHPATSVILGVGASDKLTVTGSTVEINSGATTFLTSSATTSLHSGTINLGADAGDNINFRGDWLFDFTPNAGNTYDIGTATLRVREIFSNNSLNTSFSKFKKEIVSLDDSNCMGVCSALDTIEFKWNDDMFKLSPVENDPIKIAEQTARQNRKYVGFNADALKTMMPDAVNGDMIYTNAVIGVLLGAVRHLQARIIQLENP